MSTCESKTHFAGFPFSNSGLNLGTTMLSCMAQANCPESQSSCDAIPPADYNADCIFAIKPPAAKAGPASRTPVNFAYRRLGPPQAHVRVLPVETFVWGGRALPPTPRTRPDHALIWLTSGRMQLDFPRIHHKMRQGELRLVVAGTAFAALPLQSARGYVALIPQSIGTSSSTPFPANGLAGQVGQDGAALLVLLRRLADKACTPDRELTRSLISSLTARLEQLDAATPEPPAILFPVHDRPLVERFIALARTRLSDCGPIAEMAQEMQTTTAALDRACLAARGKRAIELLHELRLERAVELLRGTSLPPSKIAAALGYSSHGHFTRAFAAATGRPPETFRT